MKRTLIVFLLVNLILSACAPVSAPTPIPAPSATPLPTATAMPTSTATPTSTPTATSTATPTPIPTIQVGNLSLPDPRVTNPELFDLRNPNAPIPQFVNAMKMAGIEIEPQIVAARLNYVGIEDRVFALTDQTGNLAANGIPLFSWKKTTGWAKAEWWHVNEVSPILLSMGIDPHIQPYKEQALDFAFRSSMLWIMGSMMHEHINHPQWGGVVFLNTVLPEFNKKFPSRQLTIGISHLFWHHDSFPPELSDNNISLQQRQSLCREYMRERVREVIRPIKPYLERGIIQKVVLNLANETFWEYQGNTGWEGEYSDYPLYDLLGKEWIPEAYVAFQEVIREQNLERDKFILVLNDWGLEVPGLKPQYWLSQRKWVLQRIADRLGISKEQVQLDIGLQFGLGYDNEYNRKVRSMLQTSEGRLQIQRNIARISEEGNGIWITEFAAKGDAEGIREIVDQLVALVSVSEINLKGINIWAALQRDDPYVGNVVVDKYRFVPTYGYYALMKLAISKGLHD